VDDSNGTKLKVLRSAISQIGAAEDEPEPGSAA
jgi:hypothetical protein